MAQEVKIIANKKTKNDCSIIAGELNTFLFANQENPMHDSVVQSVREQSIDILCKCVKSSYQNTGKISETGLVIGYVQSGKTLSFTSVISLAADNNYKLVIVLAGRDILLLDQTDKRLKKDLGQTKNKRKYAFFKNPSLIEKNDILTQLENTRKPTIIITVLKHQKYLNNLAELISTPKIASLISKYGVLIIDDEADQASLNTKSLKNSKKETWEKDEFSAIYDGIINLRNNLNYHSYIQYTATPQANLLYDYLDILSPKWHIVLKTGDAYTGGKTFFKDKIDKGNIKPKFKNQFILGLKDNFSTVYQNVNDEKLVGKLDLVRLIPIEQTYHPTENPLNSAPETLIECLRSFLINATILTELKHAELGMDHVSMIIHFHSFTSSSKKVNGWIQNIFPQWLKDYKRNDTTLKNAFRETYLEEEKVFVSGYNFDDIYKEIEYILSNYKIHMVLAGTEEIDWDSAQAHILIGGMKLDRGFTVENLTHTYMPRYSIANSQADTIQQRCRFFGYKRKYIEHCKVYLPGDAICEYTDYVNDEEDLRTFLSKHDDIQDFFDTKQTLSLSPRLQPTRKNILSYSLVGSHLKGTKYFNPLAVSSFNYNIILKESFLKLISKYNTKIQINHGTNDRVHDVFKIPINLFKEEMLNKIQLDSPIEILFKKKIGRYIDFLIDENKEYCFIINMSQGNPRGRKIISRKIKNKSGIETIYKIDNPFSGKDQKNPSRWPDDKSLIVGDPKYNKIFNYEDELIIQLHTIRITECKDSPKLKNEVFFTLSFYFPPKMARRYVALNK
jgi:hypothetical protein